MSKKKRLVPKKRFKDFEHKKDWEENLFSNNIISIQTGTNLLGSEDNTGTPLVKMGNIQRGYFILDKIEYISNTQKIEEENIIYYGDFLFNTRNTLELVGKAATWTEESNKYAFNNNIARFTFNKKIDTIFFNYLYNQPSIIKQIRGRATGTTSVAAVYPQSLDSIKYNIPTIIEQNKIGSFFKQLDEMIQLQQSKVNKVKDIKSAYLSEMFPKEGEKFPKKRFEGFTEAWKTIKMRDVFPTVLSGNRLPKTSLKSGNIPYILATTENNGVYARIDKETRDYHGNNMKTFNTPSISFSIDNPEAIFLQEENFFTSNIMRVLINKVLDKEGYIFFVETLRKATGGFDWGVKFSGPVVLDLDINVPFNRIENKIDYQEIKKIGLFISKLDEAEKLENIKLDKLKKLKQAYMNDMFV